MPLHPAAPYCHSILQIALSSALDFRLVLGQARSERASEVDEEVDKEVDPLCWWTEEWEGDRVVHAPPKKGRGRALGV